MSDPSGTDKRPDLFDLRREHHFHTGALSSAANVSETTILKALQGQPIARVDAEKLLRKLNTLYQQGYSLKTVRMKLLEGD